MPYANRRTRLRTAQPEPAGELNAAFNDSVDVSEAGSEPYYQVHRAANPRFPAENSPDDDFGDHWQEGMADSPDLRAKTVRGVDPALHGRSRRYGG